jgi:hypothetical protein
MSVKIDHYKSEIAYFAKHGFFMFGDVPPHIVFLAHKARVELRCEERKLPKHDEKVTIHVHRPYRRTNTRALEKQLALNLAA